MRDLTIQPVKPGTTIRLRDSDARVKGAPRDAELKSALRKWADRLGELQEVFYADGRYSLLVVLQGRDACGKDGTVRKVFEAVNPQGCQVTGFKAPTPRELAHDFLWRIHQHVPPRGMFGIFNRSHYEDILVPRVKDLLPAKVWGARYDQINAFERILAENNVVILKFFLHVSRAEQKRRLQERLTDPHKNWKFNAGDLDDRRRWGAYTDAYIDVLRRCSTRHARWYVVPADVNRVRDVLVARTIVETLERLKLRYPRAPREVLSLKVR